MLFNEQEMIALCNEMGIDLIDNDGSANFSPVDSSLFDLTKVTEEQHVKTNKCEFVMDETILLAS